MTATVARDNLDLDHNWRVAKILERIRAWRRKPGAAAPTDASKDWMTVGKTFRASDTVFDKNLPNTSRDEGRPRH